MAAYVIKPTAEQWSVIKDFLDACGEGAIIIPPAVDGELKEQGVHIEDGALIEYDFGGEATSGLMWSAAAPRTLPARSMRSRSISS